MNGMEPFAYFVISLSYACYGAAFVMELVRLRQRGTIKYTIVNKPVYPAVIGFGFHTLFLYQQHVIAEQPLGGAAMLFLASAWGLVLLYLLWLRRYPNIPFGLIVLPIAGLLIGSGIHWASTFETTGLSLRSFAKMLHLVSVTGFVIAMLVFIICRVLYALEVRLLRKKHSLTPPIKLPSLEWSKTVSRISLAIAIGCLCLSAIGGIILNII